MEYRIVLTRMEFHALHGCYELERKVGNRFTVDLELTAELGHAATDDDVRKTVNYLTAYEVVEMQMRITQHTIERVATNIIEAIYATFPQVRLEAEAPLGQLILPQNTVPYTQWQQHKSFMNFYRTSIFLMLLYQMGNSISRY